jgi:hypothetical protein
MFGKLPKAAAIELTVKRDFERSNKKGEKTEIGNQLAAQK